MELVFCPYCPPVYDMPGQHEGATVSERRHDKYFRKQTGKREATERITENQVRGDDDMAGSGQRRKGMKEKEGCAKVLIW